MQGSRKAAAEVRPQDVGSPARDPQSRMWQAGIWEPGQLEADPQAELWARVQRQIRRQRARARLVEPLLTLALAGTGGLLLAGYAGALHPLGDSLAVFRLQGAVVLALLSVLALWLRLWRRATVGLMLALAAGLPLVAAYGHAGVPGVMRLYQKNMLFKNNDLAGLDADIRALAPDVVTLQEVSEPNAAMLARLANVLPHQLRCGKGDVGGVAVLTRLPLIGGQQVCTGGLAALRVQSAEGPVWLVSVHLGWPWPYRQAEQARKVLLLLGAMEGPVVIGGDFNMVAWSSVLGRVRAVAGVRRVEPVQGSFAQFAPFAVLPIDQVMAPGGGAVEVRPELGSDHRGLFARVSVTPQG